MLYLTDGKRHLVSYPYSIENLHIMATELGINRCWYHAGKYPHYDIPKRKQAEIEDLCIIVRPRDIIGIIRQDKHFS